MMTGFSCGNYLLYLIERVGLSRIVKVGSLELFIKAECVRTMYFF